MKILRQLLVLAVLMLAPVFAAYADGSTNLYIHTKDGEKIGFSFSDKPTITFNRSNALVIKSANTTTTVKGFSTVHKITFDDAADLTETVTDTQATITPKDGNIITFEGFADQTPVTICNVNGQILKTVYTTEETTEISLDAYGKGVYIIAAGEVVCKIAIK